jgi:hypothetical protein
MTGMSPHMGVRQATKGVARGAPFSDFYADSFKTEKEKEESKCNLSYLSWEAN